MTDTKIDNPFEGLDEIEKDLPEEMVEDIAKHTPPAELPLADVFESSKMVYRKGELVEQRVYHITEKINALAFLNASKRYRNGEMVPFYSKVGKDLGIDPQVLSRWWKDREKILEEGQGHLGVAQSLKAMKLNDTFLEVLSKIDDVLSRGGFGKKDLSNLSKALSIVAQNSRLFENKSTKNVEHKHQHRGRVALTPPDDARSKKKKED